MRTNSSAPPQPHQAGSPTTRIPMAAIYAITASIHENAAPGWGLQRIASLASSCASAASTRRRVAGVFQSLAWAMRSSKRAFQYDRRHGDSLPGRNRRILRMTCRPTPTSAATTIGAVIVDHRLQPSTSPPGSMPCPFFRRASRMRVATAPGDRCCHLSVVPNACVRPREATLSRLRWRLCWP